jgi:hypothetical protein
VPSTNFHLGRGIYGAVFGFPGGIAWAIMVARICQLYPMACGATILAKFFNLMHKWNWPRPVMLTNHELEGFGLRVWNPAVSCSLGHGALQLIKIGIFRRRATSDACNHACLPCYVCYTHNHALDKADNDERVRTG